MGCASHLAHVLTILSHVWNIPSFAQGWSTLELGWPGSIFPQTYGKPSFPHTFYHEWWVFHVYVDFLELVTWSYNLCNSEISLDVPSREPRIVLLQQHLKMLGKHQNLRVQNIFVSHEIVFFWGLGGGTPIFPSLLHKPGHDFFRLCPKLVTNPGLSEHVGKKANMLMVNHHFPHIFPMISMAVSLRGSPST